MPHHRKTSMSPGLIVLVLTMLLGLQPVTTDLYLPALPDLSHELGATMPQAQLTLTALLLAFGLSQLVWGPVSDRFGRRPVLLWGLGAYILASVGVASSGTVQMLLIWRALQGIAMGAGVMCARAIVRDLYAPAQGATVMSKGLSGLAVIACMSPPLGGFLTAQFNWHVALGTLVLFGMAALLLIALRFEESLPRKNPHALRPRTLLKTWRSILGNPVFLAFSSLAITSYCGMFSFLAASSFVFIKVLDISAAQYGFVMLLIAALYLLGTILCRRLIPRLGVRRLVALAAGMSLAGSGTMALLALSIGPGVWTILPPMALFFVAHGIHQPCGQSGAAGPFPQAAGAASALNGFLMTASAFATGGWLGTHMDGTAFPLVYAVCFWTVGIAISAWTLVQRYGPR